MTCRTVCQPQERVFSESERTAVEFLFGLLSDSVSNLTTSKDPLEGEEGDPLTGEEDDPQEGEEEADPREVKGRDLSGDLECLSLIVDVLFGSEVFQSSFLSDVRKHDSDKSETERKRFKRRRKGERRSSVGHFVNDPSIMFTQAVANLLCLALDHCPQFRGTADFKFYVKKLMSYAAELASETGEQFSPKLGVSIAGYSASCNQYMCMRICCSLLSEIYLIPTPKQPFS